LARLSGKNKNGFIWYYETPDGNNWKKTTLNDEALKSVSQFNFLNMDNTTMICNFGWPKVSQGLFSKNAGIWKLNETYMDRLADKYDILYYSGRKVYYHNFNGFLFANK
jgi:hypothetical protein